MPQVDGRTLCRVCVSPYRSEIETMLRSPVKIGTITSKYAPLMKCTPDQLYYSLKAHIKNRHAPSKAILLAESGQSRATLDNFAQKLLEIGTNMIETDPSKVKLADVISAQKAVTDRQKLKLGESELMLKVARLFGGLPEPEVLEGEEVKSIES